MTRHNGHCGTAPIMKTCRTYDVKFQMVAQGIRALLKAEQIGSRYKDKETISS